MLKKKFVLFALFILLLFALLTYESIKGESRFIDLPIYPLELIEQGGTAVIKSIKGVFNTYIMIAGKEEENRQLLDTIDELRQEENKYIEAGLENERLRKILQLKSKRHEYITTAEVFARDPTSWFQKLWINKGVDDGIARDMVAVTSLGPVGRVHRVFKDVANVMLITDVNSAVAVMLQSSRIGGILEGRGDDRCYLKYVSKEVEVKPGERVITSGLEGIYPRGLLIGHVTDIRSEGEEIFQLIEITPAQNLNTLEEVAILKK
jgi:rod shape-determining protein MreC